MLSHVPSQLTNTKPWNCFWEAVLNYSMHKNIYACNSFSPVPFNRQLILALLWGHYLEKTSPVKQEAWVYTYTTQLYSAGDEFLPQGWLNKWHHSTLSSHTSGELQDPVDSQCGQLLLWQLHGELQLPCLHVETICNGEAKFIRLRCCTALRINNQLIQNVLVGEGWAQRQHVSML